MKASIVATLFLFALHPQPGQAQEPQAAPSEALVDRFLAVLPDRHEIDTVAGEIDAAELSRLVALNPGREGQVRSVLQANLACTGPAISAVTFRMLRSAARSLGKDRLARLVSFYEGPDYAAFKALAERAEGTAKPRAEDEAAMTRMMESYPLQAFQDALANADKFIAADQAFMSAARKCAAQEQSALAAGGLKSR